MALSNSQYDHLMRTYEQKQLDNEFQHTLSFLNWRKWIIPSLL